MYNYPHTSKYDSDLYFIIVKLKEIMQSVSTIDELKEALDKIEFNPDGSIKVESANKSNYATESGVAEHSETSALSDETIKLQSPFNIKLTGDVEGQANTDGTGTATIQTTIKGVTPTDLTTIPNNLIINNSDDTETILTMVGQNNSAIAFINNLSPKVIGMSLNGSSFGLGAVDGVSGESTVLMKYDAVSNSFNVYGTADEATHATTADTATNATNANYSTSTSVASKLGRETIGDVRSPIYLNNGTPTPCNVSLTAIYTGNVDPEQSLGEVGDIYIKFSEV